MIGYSRGEYGRRPLGIGIHPVDIGTRLDPGGNELFTPRMADAVEAARRCQRSTPCIFGRVGEARGASK